ncbi:MAG: hypothetical protein ACXVEE_42270 [Polyangiales bacterium]
MRVLPLLGMALIAGACAREPIVGPDRASAQQDAAPSAQPSASAVPEESGPRPLTSAEDADNCGYKGNLICCLEPKMSGPPPKPFCYPAR